MADDIQHELSIALGALRTAAQVCRSVQAGIQPDKLDKRDRSPVTVADFASQAIICRALGDAFGDDAIIGEEDSSALAQPENAPFLQRVREELGRVGIEGSGEQIRRWIDRGNAGEFSNRFWTLDPIDGTKGFLRGEQYAISLALIVEGRIQLALLACPNMPVQPGRDARGVIFYAAQGQGSWTLPLDRDAAPEPVRASRTADPAGARFCESVESGHSAHDRSAQVAAALGIETEPLRMDSQAKYAAVARGDAEIYLRVPTRADYRECIWDHAGGVLVVEEAGGIVTDIDGKALEFTHGPRLMANRGLVVANRELHARFLEAIRATEPASHDKP